MPHLPGGLTHRHAARPHVLKPQVGFKVSFAVFLQAFPAVLRAAAVSLCSAKHHDGSPCPLCQEQFWLSLPAKYAHPDIPALGRRFPPPRKLADFPPSHFITDTKPPAKNKRFTIITPSESQSQRGQVNYVHWLEKQVLTVFCHVIFLTNRAQLLCIDKTPAPGDFLKTCDIKTLP